MPPNVKDPGARAPKAQPRGAPRPSAPASAGQGQGSTGIGQSSRMHKVMTAVHGDDEFSAFSLDPRSRKKDPLEMNPDARASEPQEGGGKLLQFFRGFFGG